MIKSYILDQIPIPIVNLKGLVTMHISFTFRTENFTISFEVLNFNLIITKEIF